MYVDSSRWLENFGFLADNAGACSWGICDAGPMADDLIAGYRKWVEAGKNASMGYLERHVSLKSSLDNVLPSCKSLVSLAFPYFTDLRESRGKLKISRHAIGEDYHTSIRTRLKPLSRYIADEFGARVRICVDSAPVAERYWAVKAGVGIRLANGMIYVPGYGSWVFLAEILCDKRLPVHKGIHDSAVAPCNNCGRCLKACPGHAIESEGVIDCRRCRSYLTIECKDDVFEEELSLGNNVYGCDICQEVCPLNEGIESNSVFRVNEKLLNLTREDVAALDESAFANIVKGTSMQRITLAQLKRNAGLTV